MLVYRITVVTYASISQNFPVAICHTKTLGTLVSIQHQLASFRVGSIPSTSIDNATITMIPEEEKNYTFTVLNINP